MNAKPLRRLPAAQPVHHHSASYPSIEFHYEYPPSHHATQWHRDGLTGPVHFCAAVERRSKPAHWCTLSPRFMACANLDKPTSSASRSRDRAGNGPRLRGSVQQNSVVRPTHRTSPTSLYARSSSPEAISRSVRSWRALRSASGLPPCGRPTGGARRPRQAGRRLSDRS